MHAFALAAADLAAVLSHLPAEASAPLGGVVWSPDPDDEASGTLLVPDAYASAVTAVLAPDALAAARAASVGTAKSALKEGIDATAERLRLALMTPGSGQAMEYQEAQAQAAAALKAPASATAEKYPMLAASVGIDLDPQTGAPATDVLGVARSINAARDVWLNVGAAIRGARLAAKKAVDEAGTIEAARAAAAGAAWPNLSP